MHHADRAGQSRGTAVHSTFGYLFCHGVALLRRYPLHGHPIGLQHAAVPHVWYATRQASETRAESYVANPRSVHRQREGGTVRGRSAQSPRTASESAGARHASNP